MGDGMSKTLKVSKIRNGTVIDHIKAGKALEIVRMLDIPEGSVLMTLTNVDSPSMGKKDIIKIEDKFLTNEETNKIALLSPDSTINIVKDYRVMEKRKVRMPERIEDIARCPNAMCITNHEQCTTSFIFEKGEKYRCRFCERVFNVKELVL